MSLPQHADDPIILLMAGRGLFQTEDAPFTFSFGEGFIGARIGERKVISRLAARFKDLGKSHRLGHAKFYHRSAVSAMGCVYRADLSFQIIRNESFREMRSE